jgi:hypothetical protein
MDALAPQFTAVEKTHLVLERLQKMQSAVYNRQHETFIDARVK